MRLRFSWTGTCSGCTFKQVFPVYQESNFGNNVFPLQIDTLEEDIWTCDTIAIEAADLWEVEVCWKNRFHQDGFSWKPFVQYLISLSFSLLISRFLLLTLFILLFYILSAASLCLTTSTLLFPCFHLLLYLCLLQLLEHMHTDGFSEYWPLLHIESLSGLSPSHTLRLNGTPWRKYFTFTGYMNGSVSWSGGVWLQHSSCSAQERAR